jgi:vitamin B12 transporter
VGLFVDADAAIRPWLRLAGGLRGETIHGGNRGGFFGDRAIDHQPVAASGAVTWASRHGLLVTAQAARGFRDPTLTDRFSRGPVGRGFLEGNPDLLPETSRQFDLTVRYSSGRVDLHGAAYRYEIRNLVERYTAAPDLFRIRNRGRARLTGAELAAHVGVSGGVALGVIAQTSRGRDADDGTPINDVAPPSLALIVRHAWGARLSSYVKVSAVGAHDAAGPGEVPTPAYRLVDVAAGWRLRPGLDLRVTVRNAFDASYYSSAGPRWVLAPGRQVLVTLVVAAGAGG